MAYNQKLAERIRERLAETKKVKEKEMMGGLTFMVNDKMCIGIIKDEMMLQKLDYLHANPVKRGWVASPEHWKFSSAHEWLERAIPQFRCDDWD